MPLTIRSIWHSVWTLKALVCTQIILQREVVSTTEKVNLTDKLWLLLITAVTTIKSDLDSLQMCIKNYATVKNIRKRHTLLTKTPFRRDSLC